MQKIFNTETGIINLIFLNQSRQIVKFSDLKNHTLNEQIYYKPSMFPYISRVTNEGSVYENHTIPSGQYSFRENSPDKLKQKFSLEKYIDNFYFQLNNHLETLLKTNKKILLSFSGGIDSLVLLSFFDKFNAFDKIEIVNYENYFVENHPDLLRNNFEKKTKLKEIEKYTKKTFNKIKITDNDWLFCANHGNYTDLKSYCLSTLIKNFPNFIIVSGLFGDKTLLHDSIWLDQKVSDNCNFNDLLQNKSLYMNNFLDYNLDKEKIQLENYTFYMRNFNDYGLKIDNPLSIGLRLCRQIDLSTVSLLNILDADVAREIIYRNVNKNYNNFISHQGNLDGDNFCKKMFPKIKLNSSIFEIPKDIKHNKFGLNWVLDSINNDKVDTNIITSLKMLQYLSALQK